MTDRKLLAIMASNIADKRTSPEGAVRKAREILAEIDAPEEPQRPQPAAPKPEEAEEEKESTVPEGLVSTYNRARR